MTFLRTGSLAALAVLALAAPASAQTIRGRVVDAATGQPVADATVTALNPNDRLVARTRTDAEGAFTLDVRRQGTFRLRGERIGYQPSRSEVFPVEVRETVEVDLRLSTEALTVAPLTVTARREPPRRRGLEMNGYYQRERAGFGHFIRREDMRNWQNYRMTHVLSRVPGFALTVDRRGREWVINKRCGGGSPKFYLDGIYIRIDRNSTLDDVVNPEQVAAIEAFRGPAEIPPQYNDSEAACGVVLIWTRSEPDPEPARAP